MNTLLISYDLGGPESLFDYQKLHAHIKGYSGWAKPLESVWLIRTEKSASQVRDELSLLVDQNDAILVINVTNTGWASWRISKEVTDWIHKFL